MMGPKKRNFAITGCGGKLPAKTLAEQVPSSLSTTSESMEAATHLVADVATLFSESAATSIEQETKT